MDVSRSIDTSPLPLVVNHLFVRPSWPINRPPIDHSSFHLSISLHLIPSNHPTIQPSTPIRPSVYPSVHSSSVVTSRSISSNCRATTLRYTDNPLPTFSSLQSLPLSPQAINVFTSRTHCLSDQIFHWPREASQFCTGHRTDETMSNIV